MSTGREALLPFARMSAIGELGTCVFYCGFIHCFGRQRFNNFGTYMETHGGLSLICCLQHALVTCYLAYATTTPTHVGLFHACPRDFRPNVINFPLDLN